MMYINFDAIAHAYEHDEAARYDFNGIFAAVSSFLYWENIAELQRTGVNVNNAAFIEANKDNFCERPEFVANRINVALLKVIRASVALNSDLARRGLSRFIIRVIKKDETGMWRLIDARILALEIASSYEQHVGQSITEPRWEMKQI